MSMIMNNPMMSMNPMTNYSMFMQPRPEQPTKMPNMPQYPNLPETQMKMNPQMMFMNPMLMNNTQNSSMMMPSMKTTVSEWNTELSFKAWRRKLELGEKDLRISPSRIKSDQILKLG